VDNGIVQVRGVEVSYATGKDLLAAYWGYLSDGGLVLDDDTLRPGELVALRITIESAGVCHALQAKVARTRDSGRAVVAFEPGQPHDMLLTEALADAENVPARRHRRYQVDLEAEVQNGSASAPGRIINVSASGCCVRVPATHREHFAAGASVRVQSGELAAQGRVVWARHTERGVEFAEEPHGVLTWVRAYLDALRGA
jgi:hypothetical protein